MAHPQQADFCKYVRSKFPEKFYDVNVLDVGSLDINGNNRYLFSGVNTTYTGIDIGPGPNVDIVCKGHEYDPILHDPLGVGDGGYDVIISTECFEHDQHWRETIENCIRLTKPGGIFLFTCATEGRQEHGTSRTTPQDSPFSHIQFNDYYGNLTEKDIRDAIDIEDHFSEHEFGVHLGTKDLYFYGIKR